MPPICVIIASSGPAMALASSGSAEAHTVEICSATGSHSRFQVSRVLSIQSLGVHADGLGGARGQRGHPVQPGLGQAHGVGDRRAGRLRYRGDEADRAGRQLAGEVVVDRAGLLAAGHHVAGAAEHLAEAAEDLTELGHVELAAANAERILPGARAGPRIGVLLALVALGVVSGREAEGQVSHALNGTHRGRLARRPPSRSE